MTVLVFWDYNLNKYHIVFANYWVATSSLTELSSTASQILENNENIITSYFWYLFSNVMHWGEDGKIHKIQGDLFHIV